MELYENIKSRRIELNLSQSELASKVGYKDKGSISRIENGLIDLQQSQIVKFANALECTPAYLMGWSDTPNNKKVSKDDILAELDNLKEQIESLNVNDITETEAMIIYKFRKLDNRGKSIVLNNLETEYNYSIRISAYAKNLQTKEKDNGNSEETSVR